MLHELLLALSGHHSTLLSHKTGIEHVLSPAETSLLASLAHLGDLHSGIRSRAAAISSSHPSTICRAVSLAIISTHLENFQQKIIEVESSILQHDSPVAGTYNTVPLSGLVTEFDGWSRRLEWLWHVIQFIQHDKTLKTCCTGSQIIGKLREEAQTGYPDIEDMSLGLIKVAETAWLRQLSAWILFGKIPTLGAVDFFITHDQALDTDTSSEVTTSRYAIESSLLPKFVSPSTADSVLFIGKSLNHIRERRSKALNISFKSSSPPEISLLSGHHTHLSSLVSPISSSALSEVIKAIRLSLSKNALQQLLPSTKVLGILRILKDFFLLEYGDFAVALISGADEHLMSRHRPNTTKFMQKNLEKLGSVPIKEGEVSAVLAHTWTTLASLEDIDDHDEDGGFDLARVLVQLSIKALVPKPMSPRVLQSKIQISEVAFDDLLFPTPTSLTLRVPSPLDLFLTSSDVKIYSHLHAYLLSIRRGHLHLSELWKLTVLRREQPVSKESSHKSHRDKLEALARTRRRSNRRGNTMRPIWATLRLASFLLTELGEYFQGEIIKSSWTQLFSWLGHQVSEPESSAGQDHDRDTSTLHLRGSAEVTSQSLPMQSPHDPEQITLAHRSYLNSLVHSLLLGDLYFPKILRGFLSKIDHLVALMHRLNTIQQNLDLEVIDAFTNYAVEHQELLDELKEFHSQVDSNVEDVIQRLKEIDILRVGESRHNPTSLTGHDDFIPWVGTGVDQLLIKLDFASQTSR
ncbi:hypothetical protein MMC12_002294 [Toensbergia leucococca]|nr:hypothetical protein [Toensbergia leucococca]